jgi:hypothetical protein
VNGLATEAAFEGVKHFGGNDEIRHGPSSSRCDFPRRMEDCDDRTAVVSPGVLIEGE